MSDKGKIAYSKQSRVSTVLTTDSLPEDHTFEVPFKNSKWSFDTNSWVLDIVINNANKLQDKIDAINTVYTESMDIVLSKYPQVERDTFPEQAVEALKYKSVQDQSLIHDMSDYPMLMAISSTRGVDLTDLVTSILEKKNSFSHFCGAVTGFKQKLMSEVELIDIDDSDAESLINEIDESTLITFAKGLVGL